MSSSRAKETKPHRETERAEELNEELKEENGRGEEPGGEGPAPDTETAASAGEEDLQTQFYRLAADFQNYKKRVDKEKNDIYAFANEKIMTELLLVLDNFQRALNADSSDKGMLEGMNLIFRQFSGVLEAAGLKEIPALGEEFDPNFHHAVIMAPQEGSKSGHVAEVLQKGYLLNGKVIRPAMVKVAE